ncbi:MAG: hypothetical protein ACKV2Q_20755 [Planctomycetaceae bacterium]
MKRQVTLLAALLLGWGVPAHVQEPAVSERLHRELESRQLNDDSRAKLRRTHKFQFDDVQLADVVSIIGKQSQLRLRLDEAALAEQGISIDTPVTLSSLRPQPLSEFLDYLLPQFLLDWRLDRGDVVITSSVKAKQFLDTRCYPVGELQRLAQKREAQLELLGAASEQLGTPVTGALSSFSESFQQSLIQVLEEETSGPWMQAHGEGGNSPGIVGEGLVVRQTERAHSEVANLLRTLTASLRQPHGSPPRLVRGTDEEIARFTHLQKKLGENIELAFTDTPLIDAAKFIEDSIGEQLWINHQALIEEGILPDTPITITASGSLGSLLNRILEPLLLAVQINHGVLEITTNTQANERLDTVVFDIADLLHDDEGVQSLIQMIEKETAGPWLNTDGEGGTVTEFLGGLLVIRQRFRVQSEIAALLHELRQAQQVDAPQPPAANARKLETRIWRAASKSEAESLERLILTFVAPSSWDSNGGTGRLRSSEDRLIIQQTAVVQQQVEKFLNQYQQAQPLGQPPAKATSKP